MAIAGPAIGAVLPEGRGGTVELPDADAALLAAPWLKPATPRLLFTEALERGRDLALHQDVLLVATADGLLLMDSAAPVPRLLGRMTPPEAEPASMLAVEAEDGTAWLLSRSRLYAIDIRDPARPLLRGSLRLSAKAHAFTVRAGRGYLLSARGLQVLDLTADGMPRIITEHAFDFGAEAIATDGETVYLAAGGHGLFAIGVDGRVHGYQGSGPVLDVDVGEDGRVYLAQGEHGLTVLERDDGDLRWLGSLRGTGAIDRVRVRGSRATVRDGDVLYLLDVENPLAMERSALLLDEAGDGRGNDDGKGDAGNTGCCTAWLQDGDRVLALAGDHLLGIALRQSPRTGNEGLAFGQGVNFGGQRRIHLDGDIAYVADWFAGLHIYDLSDPRRPALLSSLHSAGSPKGVVVRDGTAFIADDDHGLLVADVTDPRAPRALGRLPLPGLAYTPVLDGERLYLAAHHGGLLIIDVTNPRVPALLAHYDTPGKAWSLRVRDGVAWVADDDAGLAVIDVSDPRNPRELARYRPGGRVEEVVLDGEFAYLALYDDGVHILDIRDPATPRLLTRVATTGNARGLALRGERLYIADWMAGVQILDVSDPARPQLVAVRDTDGAAWGLALRDDAIVVADWWGGLLLLDSAAPAEALAVYPPRDPVRAVAVHDGFAFVAQDDAGLQVFDIRNPLNPTWVTGIALPGASALALSPDQMGDRAWVLHAGGTRVAAIDISDPFQARMTADRNIGGQAQVLRALGAAVAAIGTDGYTLIDASPETPHTAEPMPNRISNQTWNWIPERIVDASFDGERMLVADAAGNIRELDAAARPARTLVSFEAGVTRLLATEDHLFVLTPDDRLHVLATGDVSAPAVEIPVGAVDAMTGDGSRIHLARSRSVRTIEFDADGWRIVAGWETMAPVTDLAVGEEALYLAGSGILRALSLAPELAAEATLAGGLRLHVPPGLPPGSYDLVPGHALDAAAIEDAVHIEPLRFGRRANAPPSVQ